MSHWKATSSSMQRFNDYLNGLREAFERRSKDTLTSPRCFDICLGNLKGEFELMVLELESLRKEADEYREKVKAQAKELQSVRHNFICQGCGNVPSTQLKTLETSSSSRRVFQSKPSTSSRISSESRQTLNTPRPQSLSTSKHADDIMIFAHSRPSPLRQRLASIEQSKWSITSNNHVKKELDVEIAYTFLHGETTVWSVKFSQDGKSLAAGCNDGKAYIYDVQTGTLSCVLKDLLSDDLRIGPLCFSGDGKYLATGSYDGDIYVWEINTKYVRNAFKGHTRCINSLNFSPNGRLLVSASDDNTVRLWNTRDGAAKFLIEDSPTILDDPCYSSPVFTPDGTYVAASHHDGVVRIWSVRSGQLVRRVRVRVDSYTVTFMPDGKALVTGSRDTTLKYWDVRSLYPTAQIRPVWSDSVGVVEEQTRPEREFQGHEGFVYSVAISPDGRWIASSSHDKSIRIWDTRSAAVQCILKSDCAQVSSVDFSPAGRYLASGGSDGAVRIWSYY